MISTRSVSIDGFKVGQAARKPAQRACAHIPVRNIRAHTRISIICFGDYIGYALKT